MENDKSIRPFYSQNLQEGNRNEKTTGLQKVKATAHASLPTDLHETKCSPVVVSQPFTGSGFVTVLNANYALLVAGGSCHGDQRTTHLKSDYRRKNMLRLQTVRSRSRVSHFPRDFWCHIRAKSGRENDALNKRADQRIGSLSSSEGKERKHLLFAACTA